jgi:hypothetical protein
LSPHIGNLPGRKAPHNSTNVSQLLKKPGRCPEALAKPGLEVRGRKACKSLASNSSSGTKAGCALNLE